jgi:hypothetical protein
LARCQQRRRRRRLRLKGRVSMRAMMTRRQDVMREEMLRQL